MDELTGLSCAAFAEALASKASVPGGGSAAAMVGALGTALCSMVGNFTVGKKRYAAVESDVTALLEQCGNLQTRLLALVQVDAQAFEPLSKAYSIPKNDPLHDETLEKATLDACKAPVEVVRGCAEAIDALDQMLAKGSRMLLSDVGCGALLCKAAMESAALNVFVNTRTLRNRQQAERMEQEMDALLCKYLPMAQQITQTVSLTLRKED